jgi:hypothetical protein
MTAIGVTQWKTFSERFSHSHDGWSASLLVREPDGTIETAVDDRPFRGMTFEKRAGHEALILTFGDDAEEHLAHIITAPRDLSVLENAEDRECAVIVGLEDGSGCVLELANPFIAD